MDPCPWQERTKMTFRRRPQFSTPAVKAHYPLLLREVPCRQQSRPRPPCRERLAGVPGGFEFHTVHFWAVWAVRLGMGTQPQCSHLPARQALRLASIGRTGTFLSSLSHTKEAAQSRGREELVRRPHGSRCWEAPSRRHPAPTFLTL